MLRKDATCSSKDKTTKMTFSFLKICVPKTKAPKFVKETRLQLKSHVAPHKLIVGDTTTLLSPVDRSSRQKLNRITWANRCYEASGPNRYLQKISPKHTRICLFLCISWNFLQNSPHPWTQSNSQQIKEYWHNSLHPGRPPWIKSGYQ